jgi:hypothetical protein
LLVQASSRPSLLTPRPLIPYTKYPLESGGTLRYVGLVTMTSQIRKGSAGWASRSGLRDGMGERTQGLGVWGEGCGVEPAKCIAKSPAPLSTPHTLHPTPSAFDLTPRPSFTPSEVEGALVPALSNRQKVELKSSQLIENKRPVSSLIAKFGDQRILRPGRVCGTRILHLRFQESGGSRSRGLSASPSGTQKPELHQGPGTGPERVFGTRHLRPGRICGTASAVISANRTADFRFSNSHFQSAISDLRSVSGPLA